MNLPNSFKWVACFYDISILVRLFNAEASVFLKQLWAFCKIFPFDNNHL